MNRYRLCIDNIELTESERFRLLADWEINCDFEMVNEPLAALPPQPSGNAITKVSAHGAASTTVRRDSVQEPETAGAMA